MLSQSAAAASTDQASQSRLDALRDRLREEEGSAVKLQDFSFSGNVSYGTAVPRRTRDKTGKVALLCLSFLSVLLMIHEVKYTTMLKNRTRGQLFELRACGRVSVSCTWIAC